MSIIVDNITYKYSEKSAYETVALDEVSLKIDDGEFIGIIGHSGSGKSTLAMHLNGLLKAQKGTVYFNGEDIYDKQYDLKGLRTQVGMVFQYPEHQLFETTVLKDIKFGPLNQGLSDEEATGRAYEALELLHFPKEMFDQPPFTLSGGQKRIAAIAGVLAMKPAVLILDEPTAGLDPYSKTQILDILRALHRQTKRTVIMISHSMEDVAEYVDRIIVMSQGKILFDDTPKGVFSHSKELDNIGLAVPEVSVLTSRLQQIGFDLPAGLVTVEEAYREILKCLGK